MAAEFTAEPAEDRSSLQDFRSILSGTGWWCWPAAGSKQGEETVASPKVLSCGWEFRVAVVFARTRLRTVSLKVGKFTSSWSKMRGVGF